MCLCECVFSGAGHLVTLKAFLCSNWVNIQRGVRSRVTRAVEIHSRVYSSQRRSFRWGLKLNKTTSLCAELKINTKSAAQLFAVNKTATVWLPLFFRFDGVSVIFVNWNLLQILFDDDEFKRVNIRRQWIFLPIRLSGPLQVYWRHVFFHQWVGNNFYPCLRDACLLQQNRDLSTLGLPGT